MNNLNSVLIEGILREDPMAVDVQGKSQHCILHIMTKRYHREVDEYMVQEDDFTVIAEDAVAKQCIDFLKEGRAIRVVGRLMTASNVTKRYALGGSREATFIFIIAEHIEFKPEK